MTPLIWRLGISFIYPIPFLLSDISTCLNIWAQTPLGHAPIRLALIEITEHFARYYKNQGFVMSQNLRVSENLSWFCVIWRHSLGNFYKTQGFVTSQNARFSQNPWFCKFW